MGMFLFFSFFLFRQDLWCAMLQHVSSPCPSNRNPNLISNAGRYFPCQSERQQAMQNAIRSDTISSHRPQGASMAPNMSVMHNMYVQESKIDLLQCDGGNITPHVHP
jgi:hypothetical protein